MKKEILKLLAGTMVMAFCSMTTAADRSSPPMVRCRSIDVTHRPFYAVAMVPETRHKGKVQMWIVRTEDLSGQEQTVWTVKGRAHFDNDMFEVEFAGEANGIIQGKKLPNGTLQAKMAADIEERDIELVCQSKGSLP